MNPIFVNRLSPFLVHFEAGGHPIGVRWYGLAYLLAFVFGFVTLLHAGRRGQVRGLSQTRLETLMWALIGGVVVGGRLGFVAQNASAWRADPLFPLEVWQGGMAFFGGLAGVLLAVGWGVRRFGLDFWQVTDALTFPSALGLAVGRVANFINGELVGVPTGAHWGVIFPAVDGVPRHPSQLYESVSHLLMWAFLLWLSRRQSDWAYARAGRLSMTFLAFYGLARFGTDFFRADETYFGPFSSGQWVSLLIGLLGLAGLIGWKGRPARAPQS